MSRSRIFALALFVSCLFLSHDVIPAQTVSDREQIAREIESLREQIKAKEAQLLAPARRDEQAFADFLRQPDTGLVRLLPRERWHRKLSIDGDGAFYSFARRTHDYQAGRDIYLEQRYLGIGFAGADFGFLSNLGDVPLGDVTAETDGVRFLASFVAPTAEPEARGEQRRTGTSAGFEVEGWTYNRRLPMLVNQTYALRSVSYGESDILVVFRVVRQDTDGSVILLWRMLKKFPTPELLRNQPDAASR